MSRFGAVLCFLLTTLTAGCGDGAGDGPAESEVNAAPWFEERAAQVGVDFVHDSGQRGDEYLFPEIVCGGAALFDKDGDGDLDLYLVQGRSLRAEGDSGQPANALYENAGDGTFTDVTGAAGVGDTGYGMGCTAADYDGDGDIDLYVTNYGPNVLYRNEGDGRFVDVSAAAGVDDPSFSASCAFVDYDGDGLLDLFVVNYVGWSLERSIKCYAAGRRDYCSPSNFSSPAPDHLYRNMGGGRFEDVTAEVGIDAVFGNGLGVGCADFDGNGHVDIYVANDAMANQAWMNDVGGHFTDRALISGSALNRMGATEAGMGVSVADLNSDGQFDLFVSHLVEESNTLYMNNGGMFRDATALHGLDAASMRFTAFGVGFADFDHDGLLDLYVATGAVKRGSLGGKEDEYAEPDQVFRGVSAARFEEIRPRGAMRSEKPTTARGAAFGDIDGDGDVDVVVVARDAPVQVLFNVAEKSGPAMQLQLIGSDGSDAIGAVARIVAGGKSWWCMVSPGQSYCSSNDPRVHCGIGAATEAEVEVTWPDGTREGFGTLPAGALQVLVKGSGG